MNKEKGNVLDMVRFVFKNATGKRKYLSISLFSLVFISILEFTIPQVTKYIIDDIIPNKLYSRLYTFLGLLMILAFSLNFLSYMSTYLISKVSHTAIVDIRVDLFKHTLNQDFAFFESQKTGDLMTRFTGDVKAIQELISPSTLGLIGDIITFIFVFIFMMIKDVKLTLLISITFPILYFLNKYFSSRIRIFYRKVRKSVGVISNHLQNSLSSILLLKNSGTEDFERGRFYDINNESKENHIKVTRYQALFGPSIELLNYFGMTLVLGYGAIQVMNDNLTVGAVVTYLAYLKLLQNPMKSLSQMVSRLQQALVSYERIMEIYDVNPVIVNKENPIEIYSIEDSIEFSNVSFSYNNSSKSLNSLNFNIPKGKITALVGSSGSGKTTTTKLINRLYDPTCGGIFIDGVDIRNFSLKSLRSQVGVVSQDIELIDGTVLENILYGSENSSIEDVAKAADMAMLTEFISSLPKKYDTEIGERGIKLSGGQKQRIAIARVFLKNAPILILDEATASLDNESERYIQNSLDYLMDEKTSLVIAHRLSTIHHADNILVMENGNIIETGNHNELMSSSGRYRSLYESQFI